MSVKGMRGRPDQGASGAAPDLEAALADRQAPRYSVGQAAELLGVRPWFLRRLDTLGVVRASRSGGDQRRYSRSQLEQVADAKTMMEQGISTEGVRRVMALQAQVERLEAELAGAHARLRLRRADAGDPGRPPKKKTTGTTGR
jgi:MerR family transcriptional regulator/heat shock protein HspR